MNDDIIKLMETAFGPATDKDGNQDDALQPDNNGDVDQSQIIEMVRRRR